MSIKVRVISNWTDSASLHGRIIEQSLYQESDGIVFVDDDSYHWLVIFNDRKDFSIKVPKERVIGFLQEPPDHGYFFDRNIGDYCSVVYTCAEPGPYGIAGNAIGFPCGMFYYMDGPLEGYLDEDLINRKQHDISMVTSGISHGFYIHRVQLAAELAARGSVDVYGKGLKVPGTKGELTNKKDGLLPYRYTVCIENGIWDDYISDKIIDAVLCRTIPIYVGARNILKYIPFAFTITSYSNPAQAAEEIAQIVSSTNYTDFIPQMNAWVRTYAHEYTLYSKIRQHILSNK
jgi:hypothetical protein